MPRRTAPLINENTYHVFNRGLDRRPTFIYKSDYRRAIRTLQYYQYANHYCGLANHLRKSIENQADYLSKLKSENREVDVIAYCLMPNHFHFLLTQKSANGISHFLKQFQGSYTKYFNSRNNRVGSLFQTQFKAVKVETSNQLLHVCRYIHLNPLASGICQSRDDVAAYPWSSLHLYLTDARNGILNRSLPLTECGSLESFKRFTLDSDDIELQHSSIQHLLFED